MSDSSPLHDNGDSALEEFEIFAAHSSSPDESPMHSILLPKWFPLLFFFVLACVFHWKSLFAGDVFLPAGLLGHLSPWKQSGLYPTLPPWNPLRWDGIGQFYPWRKFAADVIRSGRLPLWNPYQFGGSPFVANSQSAVFYPGSAIFLLISNTARAFVWNAILHTSLCGWFTYLFMGKLSFPNAKFRGVQGDAQSNRGCSEIASLFAGVVFAFSAWQVAWLQLPTFLATSCWIPLVLRQTGEILSADLALPSSVKSKFTDRRKHNAGKIAALALAIGMMLLAGHLQIAFYGLLTALFYAVFMIFFQIIWLCYFVAF